MAANGRFLGLADAFITRGCGVAEDTGMGKSWTGSLDFRATYAAMPKLTLAQEHALENSDRLNNGLRYFATPYWETPLKSRRESGTLSFEACA